MKTISSTIAIIALIFFSNSNVFSQTTKLIVYRKGSPYGLLAHYQVKIDGKETGSLKNNSVESFDITPGEHTLSPRQDHRAITFNAKAGQTYVVKYKTRIGIFGARPKLKIMTIENAQQDSKLVASADKMKM